jgi:hypothetical protein
VANVFLLDLDAEDLNQTLQCNTEIQYRYAHAGVMTVLSNLPDIHNSCH